MGRSHGNQQLWSLRIFWQSLDAQRRAKDVQAEGNTEIHSSPIPTITINEPSINNGTRYNDVGETRCAGNGCEANSTRRDALRRRAVLGDSQMGLVQMVLEKNGIGSRNGPP